jgi:hypothetical protein
MYYFDDEFKQHFLDKLQNLVVSGESISHHKSLESETVVKNSDGEIIRTMNTVKNERNTTMLPTPSWVMQMIDRNLSLEQSIKNCQNAGYLVLDPNEVPDENNRPRGISDETVELIKSRLLGFSSLEESQEALEKHGGSYGTYER